MSLVRSFVALAILARSIALRSPVLIADSHDAARASSGTVSDTCGKKHRQEQHVCRQSLILARGPDDDASADDDTRRWAQDKDNAHLHNDNSTSTG